MYEWLRADYYYLCPQHKIPFPRGATCPKCDFENGELIMQLEDTHMDEQHNHLNDELDYWK